VEATTHSVVAPTADPAAGTSGYPSESVSWLAVSETHLTRNQKFGACQNRQGQCRARPRALIHEPALSPASDIDKSFLLAMAHDDGPSKMAGIQQRLNVDVNYASQYRLCLIAAELIYRTHHGYVDFALPYLREYLRDHAAADA
jgi:hypothetical protein